MVGLSTKEIKRQLQQMDPYEFEELVADVWELQGYQTTVRPASGDRGIDVEAIKRNPVSHKVLIQVKRYSEGNKVGSQQVRNYATLYQQVDDADTVVIITTSEFTTEAKKLGDDLGVKLKNGYDFCRNISEIGAKDLLNKYRLSSQSQVKGNRSSKSVKDFSVQSSTTENPDTGNTESSQGQSETSSSKNGLSRCPICTPKGQVGFRKGHCNSCDSTWRIEKSGIFLSTQWKANGGPEDGEVKSRTEWQKYLHPSTDNENTSRKSNIEQLNGASYWIARILSTLTVLCGLSFLIFGFLSVITGSIYGYLIPTGGLTLVLFLLMLPLAWLQQRSMDSE